MLVILNSSGHFSSDQSDAAGTTPMVGQVLRRISDTLRDCNYTEYRGSEPNVAIFLKSDIKPDPSLQPAS
jgi:hypothetical protein